MENALTTLAIVTEATSVAIHPAVDMSGITMSRVVTMITAEVVVVVAAAAAEAEGTMTDHAVGMIGGNRYLQMLAEIFGLIFELQGLLW